MTYISVVDARLDADLLARALVASMTSKSEYLFYVQTP